MKDVLSAHQLSLEIITNLCYEDGKLLPSCENQGLILMSITGDEEDWEDMEEETEIGANGGDEQNGTMSIVC